MRYRLQTGFSLLEILVALAVIGIGMSSALSLTDRTVGSFSEVEQKTYANWLAENQIVELKLMGQAETGQIEGEKEFAGRNWFWRAIITPTFDADVLEMQVSISLAEDFNDITTQTTTYIQAMKNTANTGVSN